MEKVGVRWSWEKAGEWERGGRMERRREKREWGRMVRRRENGVEW